MFAGTIFSFLILPFSSVITPNPFDIVGFRLSIASAIVLPSALKVLPNIFRVDFINTFVFFLSCSCLLSK